MRLISVELFLGLNLFRFRVSLCEGRFSEAVENGNQLQFLCDGSARLAPRHDTEAQSTVANI